MRAFSPGTPRRAAIAGGRYCAVRPRAFDQRILMIGARALLMLPDLERLSSSELPGGPI